MITIDELKRLGGFIAYTPVGVIRLAFRKSFMYHFFSDLAPPLLVDNIHTHPHSFTSSVKKGSIKHDIFQYSESEQETDHCLRSFSYATTGAEIQTRMENIEFNKVLTFNVTEGNTYYLHYTTMHYVTATNNTVTLLNCDPYIGALKNVDFIMRKDVVYKEEELKNLKTEKECWEIVEQVLAA